MKHDQEEDSCKQHAERHQEMAVRQNGLGPGNKIHENPSRFKKSQVSGDVVANSIGRIQKLSTLSAIRDCPSNELHQDLAERALEKNVSYSNPTGNPL
jgi:hypothetical protein